MNSMLISIVSLLPCLVAAAGCASDVPPVDDLPEVAVPKVDDYHCERGHLTSIDVVVSSGKHGGVYKLVIARNLCAGSDT